MSYKKNILYLLIPFILFELVVVVTSFYHPSSAIGKTFYDILFKFDSLITSIGIALFALIPLFVIFLFTKEAIFKTWSKFALVYLPLAVILLAISPSSNADIYGLDRELITWFTSGLFFTISILIIAIKSWKLRE